MTDKIFNDLVKRPLMRVVVDTNLWISYLIQSNSPVAAILDDITKSHTLLYSYPVLWKLADVLTRPKFAKYIDMEDVKAFVTELTTVGESVTITLEVSDCRDPKDNKFLELALFGRGRLYCNR